MPTATRTFRVFVSSTFEDLKAERDALQREVFPRLRKLCEENGARFQAIDLRWGVRDEATLDQQTMVICLREIERCQRTGIKPNFIVLLGERYGWRPLPARIEAGEFNKIRERAAEADKRLIDDWYECDENAVPPEFLLKPRTGEFADKDCWGEVEQRLHRILREAAREAGIPEESLINYEASATHQEILKGLGQSEEERRHVFAFFREAAKGVEEDEDLGALKDELRQKLPEGNVCPFSASDLAALCADVEEKLSAVILGEAGKFTSRDALEMEIEAHNLFAQERSKVFYGRTNALDAIENYIRGPERRALVLHSASGSGKSAVMAKASEQYTGPGRMIRRFIGASPESASGHALLTSLCKQIAPGETPVDYAQLEKAFQERLATAEQPMVLFIDALDQLSASDPARGAAWLQAELPAHVKVIVSTTDDGERLPQGLPVALERMTTAEGGQALDELLRGTDPKEQRRTLQQWQRDAVLEHFERCGLPLYLKLAAEESRLWKSFSSPDACRLGEGIAGILDTLFDRLASNANHGPVLVERSLGYLAAARYGLTEDEMLDVLTADDVVWGDFDKKKHHDVSERRLPVVVWSRLSLDLEPYLTERAAPGGTVIAFYHRQLAERVEAKFLAGDEAQARHTDLAGYFCKKPAWLDEGHKTPDARRAAELVYQQRSARQWTKAESTLFDCPFLFAKVAAGMVLDLDDDYQTLIRDAEARELPRHDALCLIQSALQLSLQVVAKDSAQFASQIFGRLHTLRAKSEIDAFLGELEARTPRPWLRLLKPTLHAADSPILRVLEDYTEYEVDAVAISADGKRAVSGSDKTLRVWDLEGNQPPRILEGHTGQVTTVAISADGRFAVSGSANSYGEEEGDFSVRVWDLEGNQPPRILNGHTNSVWAVAISADGKRVLSGSADETVRLWDLEGHQPPRILYGHTNTIMAVALSADGKRAISGSFDHSLRVWDLEERRPIRFSVRMFWPLSLLLPSIEIRISSAWAKFDPGWRLLEGHTDKVWSVAISADGKSAVSGSEDMTVRVWDLEGNQPTRVLEGHLNIVRSVAISANGKRAVSGSSDRTLRVWDLESSQSSRVLEGHTGPVHSVALSADGMCAISASEEKTLRVWDLKRVQPSRIWDHTYRVLAVALSANGKRAVSGGDMTVRVWDLDSGQPPRVLEGHTLWVDAVALSNNGKRAISGSHDKTLRVWDLERDGNPSILEGHTSRVKAVSLSDDGTRAVSGSDDNTLRIWDLEGDQPPRILEGHTSGVNAVALSGDGKRAISGSSDKTMRVWDLEGKQPTRILEGHTGRVHSVALSADGKRAVSGSGDPYNFDGHDYDVRVWDLVGIQPPLILHGHTSSVYGVALSEDGKHAVSGSFDHSLRVWDLESGKCLAVFTCDDQVFCCDWASDRIVAGDERGHVHLFAWEE